MVRAIVVVLLAVFLFPAVSTAQTVEALPTPDCAASSSAPDATAAGTVIFNVHGCHSGVGDGFLLAADQSLLGLGENVNAVALAEDGTLLLYAGGTTYVRSSNTSTPLSPLPGEQTGAGMDAGNAGTAVGESRRPAPGGGYYTRAVRWTADGTPSALFGLAATVSSEARAVNTAGQIAGSSWQAASSGWKLLAYRQEPDGTVNRLKPLHANKSAEYARAFGIASTGAVVGLSDGKSGNRQTVIWPTPATPVVVPAPRRTSLDLQAINAAEIAAGQAVTNGQSRAVLWSAARGLVDLNTLLTAQDAGWVLRQVTEITDAGVVVGQGDLNGRQRAFRMQLPFG